MRAVVVAGHGTVRLDDVPEPSVRHPTDAVVAVHRAAVCGTDLHVLADPEHCPAGTVLGHEFVGRVVAVGALVARHRVGDLVVGADYTSCGTCWWCRQGDHWQCARRQFFGTGSAYGEPLAGAQAEQVRVPFADVTLRSVPAGVPVEAAVFLADVMATGYAAVDRSGLRAGDVLAVIGGGPVGQLTSLVAQACGAGPVVLVEPVEGRRRCGTDGGAIAVPPDKARSAVDRLTEGRGADVVVDAVGGPGGLDTAFGLVRGRGSVVSVGLHPDERWGLPVSRAFVAELSLRFAVGDLARDGDRLVALLRSGLVDPTGVVSEVVPLEQAAQAYARAADRSVLKTVLRVAD
jgi:alcohol dehydrogenase